MAGRRIRTRFPKSPREMAEILVKEKIGYLPDWNLLTRPQGFTHPDASIVGGILRVRVDETEHGLVIDIFKWATPRRGPDEKDTKPVHYRIGVG